jgi:hypothetical protein
MLFSRTAIVSVWFVMFALFAVSGWPMPLDMAVLLALVGIAVPSIIFGVLRGRDLIVAEGRTYAETPIKRRRRSE